MRDCPNCSQQIRDEAVYCRYCHTELEPPLWLTSMRRCPYCAEWIENDLEQCRYCDRAVFATDAKHAAPFVEIGSTPNDFAQALRHNLLDDDSDEAAAIAAAAAEFEAEEPSVPLAGFDAEASLYSDQAEESALLDAEPEPSFYDEPQSDLRRSLYDEPELTEEPELAAEPSALYGSGTEYVEAPVPAGDSSIWMAGAEGEGTGPLAERTDDFGRSIAGTEGVSELRADVLGTPGRIRRAAGRVARIVIIVAVLGAAASGLFVALFGTSGWGVFALSEGPLGAIISEALATDVPTETPIPEPTSTRRPAPTLPPVTEESAILPTEIAGTPSSESGCVLWDEITLDDEGTELCVYGVIKRWWAGDEIPFVAIFSEEAGTFAIIDRTTRHPVGPGSCILTRGTVEIMGGTRPNIDAQGVLEACPEDFVDE
ncbi:MAG: hypothetical protein BMS9Abin28_1717 [Anaerolineae bacterium]|nr:MAG: hypothetical protein BMS9Abin28_1717 [Anaerolineae bacterium]